MTSLFAFYCGLHVLIKEIRESKKSLLLTWASGWSRDGGTWHWWFFLIATPIRWIIHICYVSIIGRQIVSKFCTCHDSTAVVPCAKFGNDYLIKIWMKAKWNRHRFWIAMDRNKLLVNVALIYVVAPEPVAVSGILMSDSYRREFH